MFVVIYSLTLKDRRLSKKKNVNSDTSTRPKVDSTPTFRDWKSTPADASSSLSFGYLLGRRGFRTCLDGRKRGREEGDEGWTVGRGDGKTEMRAGRLESDFSLDDLSVCDSIDQNITFTQ